MSTVFPWIEARDSISFSGVYPPALVWAQSQIGAQPLLILFQWKVKEKTLGMMSPSPNAVPHISHHKCVIPNVLKCIIHGSRDDTQQFLQQVLSMRDLTTSSSPKSTCCNRSLNSISAIALIPYVLITYELIVNEAYYIERWTWGKGCGTMPQFKPQPLLLNIIEIPPVSIRGRPQIGGGLYTRKYSI